MLPMSDATASREAVGAARRTDPAMGESRSLSTGRRARPCVPSDERPGGRKLPRPFCCARGTVGGCALPSLTWGDRVRLADARGTESQAKATAHTLLLTPDS